MVIKKLSLIPSTKSDIGNSKSECSIEIHPLQATQCVCIRRVLTCKLRLLVNMIKLLQINTEQVKVVQHKSI